MAETNDKPYATGKQWIDLHFRNKPKTLMVTCNPIKREIYLRADYTFSASSIVIGCLTQRETRIVKDMLHDYVAALPTRARAAAGTEVNRR